MCGITAMFSWRNPVSAQSLHEATEQLHHRGPEVKRCWVSPDQKVGLGHARLSIIDLTSGNQPLANEDESIHAVVNGELYDFERFRQDLESRGHHLRTRSDSEIVLHLYEEMGASCLHQLRGEFAFALWDEKNRTLFAARDRFGIKPLFYTIYNDTLYLASEIKALLAVGIPAEWDEESVYQMTRFITHFGSQDKTLFKGIYQVPAGHYLLATDSQIRLYPYWDVNMPSNEQLQAGQTSDQEWIERLSHTLQEAVRLRMRADVPVGCYLSGGLDSCTMLGMAAQFTQQPIQAFTLSFDHEDYDERLIAEEMAALAQADFHVIPVHQQDLATHLSDAVWQSETMFFNAHGVAKYLLSRAVRDAGFKVVITGEGSDEIFAGYPHFRRDMLLYNNQGQDTAQVQQMLQALQNNNRVSNGILIPHGDVTGLETVKSTLGFVPSWLETFASSGIKLQSLLSQDFLAHFQARDPYRDLLNRLDLQNQMKHRDPVNQSLYLWSKFVLPSYILNVLGDRMEMAHSVEGRVPFLDHHVVELVRSMPVHLKIRGLTEKYALREAAKPFITDTVYRRQKHPFVSPPATLMPKQPLNTLMQDTFRGSSLASLPFFDQKKVIALLDLLPSLDIEARTAYDTVLTMLLSACCLHERFMANSASKGSEDTLVAV
jgi:asparagine synthase (glutamine-hydrolysing)